MEFLRRSKRIETQHSKALENLPNELKEKIFLHLSPKDIKSLMLTSKALHVEIGSNRKLMQPFTVRASKLISSPFASHRHITKIFFDVPLSLENLEKFQEIFVNFAESLEVIVTNQDLGYNSHEGMISVERIWATQFITKCTNIKTINLINYKERKLNEKHTMETKEKTLNTFEWTSAVVPCFNGVEVINMFEGVIFDEFMNFQGIDSLKEVNIYKQVGWSSNPFETVLFPLPNLQVITFHDTILRYAMIPMFLHKLKELKLVNCQFTTSRPVDFLHENSKVDELVIEGCNAIFWLQNDQHIKPKVKHLKLIRTFIPPRVHHLIEAVKNQVETLTVIDIFIQKQPSQFLNYYNSDDSDMEED